MPSNQDLSDILEPVSSNAAPTHDLSDILEPASPTKSATPSEPKTYHGFTFVEANGPETPAHYESPNGQWILPEDIERAHTEYNSKIEREAERRYNDSNAILKHGAGLNRVFLHGATIGHEPQLEASISPLLGESYSEERDIARRQLEKYREEHPYMATAGELAGGVASIFAAPELLPTRASTALSYLNPANIGKAGRYIAELPFISRNFFQGAGAGIPYGAAYASGESQAPTFSGEHAEDIARGAVTGAVAGGLMQPVLGAAGLGLRGAYQYFHPKSSSGAAEQIAEHIAASGVSGQDLIDQMVPKPSNALASQGITQDDLAQMIIRRHEGASTADLAKEYNISESTINKYFREHKKTIEVPTNILSAVRGAAGEKYKLGMTPLEREARKTSALQGIPKPEDIDPEAALRGPILQNQERIATHIDNTVGKDMETALAEAHNKKEVQAKADYNKVDTTETQFRDAVENHRRQEQLLQDKISNAQKDLNRAQTSAEYNENMYKQDTFNRMGRSPQEQAQIDDIYKDNKSRLEQEITDRKADLDRAIDFQKNSRKALGPSPKGLDVTDIIKKYRDVARKEFGSNPEAWNKFHNTIDAFFEPTPVEEGANLLGRAQTRPDIERPVNNVRDFQQARKSLNGAISKEMNSPEGDKYLASKLIEFKKELNDRAWAHNKDLESADKKWAEGATTEDILETAEGTTLNLGTKSREQMEYFRKLNPAQREIFRIGFARALKNNILNKPEGSTMITGLFMRPAVRNIVREIMGSRAKPLLENIDRERDLFLSSANALSGSRTAPMESDLKRYMEIAHGTTSAMTGAPHEAINHFRRVLGYAWGSKAAAAKNALMMTTDPAEAIRNAYKIREAPLKAAADKANIEAAAKLGALGTQNVLRSTLPFQPR